MLRIAAMLSIRDRAHRTPHRTPLAARTAILLGLLLAPVPLAAEEPAERPTIYKWIDENGIAHYTTDRERIPQALRDRVPEAAERPSSPALRRAPGSGDEAWAQQDRPGGGSRDLEATLRSRLGEGAEPASVAPTPDPAVEQRIAALETEIAEDEAVLKGELAAPSGGDDLVVADDPELRALAERLPKLIAELRALRAQAGPRAETPSEDAATPASR